MNVEAILYWADYIEKLPHTSVRARSGFNMKDYYHDCGAPCCIAGHVSESEH